MEAEELGRYRRGLAYQPRSGLALGMAVVLLLHFNRPRRPGGAGAGLWRAPSPLPRARPGHKAGGVRGALPGRVWWVRGRGAALCARGGAVGGRAVGHDAGCGVWGAGGAEAVGEQGCVEKGAGALLGRGVGVRGGGSGDGARCVLRNSGRAAAACVRGFGNDLALVFVPVNVSLSLLPFIFLSFLA